MPALHDPAFGPPVTLPFPPGTSPFRQKGNVYLLDQRYFDVAVPGGSRAVFAALPDPKVRSFFDQRFHASEWYDALPACLMVATAARLRGLSFEQHARQAGAWHAAEATRGIYSALFKFVTPESVALWGPRIACMYFESVKAETAVTGPRAVEGWLRGLPGEMAQCVSYSSAGFCTEVLLRSGARQPVVSATDVESDGRKHGKDLVRVRWRLTWS